MMAVPGSEVLHPGHARQNRRLRNRPYNHHMHHSRLFRTAGSAEEGAVGL